MEGSSPSKEEEPLIGLYDIPCTFDWRDIEIESNHFGTAVESCSIGNVGTEGAGMDMVVGRNGKLQEEVTFPTLSAALLIIQQMLYKVCNKFSSYVPNL